MIIDIKPLVTYINYPVVGIIWSDGTSTMAKKAPDEKWDTEKGLLVCYARRLRNDCDSLRDELKQCIKTARFCKGMY